MEMPEEQEKQWLESTIKSDVQLGKKIPAAVKTGLVAGLVLGLIVFYLVYTSELKITGYIAMLAFGSGALINAFILYKANSKIEMFYLKYIDKVKMQKRLSEINEKNS